MDTCLGGLLGARSFYCCPPRERKAESNGSEEEFWMNWDFNLESGKMEGDKYSSFRQKMRGKIMSLCSIEQLGAQLQN